MEPRVNQVHRYLDSRPIFPSVQEEWEAIGKNEKRLGRMKSDWEEWKAIGKNGKRLGRIGSDWEE